MFEVFRRVAPKGGDHKGTSPCKAPKCVKSTREGKPYCSKHIEFAPYVRVILGKLARRDEEARVLNLERGRIPKDGFFYRETLLLLRSKDFTAKGLARRLDLSHHAVNRLIVMMTKDRLAKSAVTSRGDMTLSGLGPRDLSSEQD